MRHSHPQLRQVVARGAQDRLFDIYILDVPTGEAHLVHRGDGWLYTVGFSPDDTKLLIGKAYSSFNQELWLLDLSNGAACYLTPHLGNARYEAVFAPDGHRLYFASDLNRDFLTLAQRSTTTPRRTESCWNASGR